MVTALATFLQFDRLKIVGGENYEHRGGKMEVTRLRLKELALELILTDGSALLRSLIKKNFSNSKYPEFSATTFILRLTFFKDKTRLARKTQLLPPLLPQSRCLKRAISTLWPMQVRKLDFRGPRLILPKDR